MMRAIRSVAVICDGCQHAYQRIAPPRTPVTPEAEQALLALAQEHALEHGWHYHEFLEELYCPRCRAWALRPAS